MKVLSKRTIVLPAAIIVLAVLITSFVFVWEPRPVIGYSISGYAYTTGLWDFNPYSPSYTSTMPSTYNYVNSNTPLMVALHWDNTGKTDASLQLIVSAKNANITWFSNFGSNNISNPVWATESDGQTYNGTTATFLSVVHGQSEMQNKYLNILPIGQPDNFTVTFTIKDSNNLFSTLSSNGTTTATYQLMKDNTYQLVN